VFEYEPFYVGKGKGNRAWSHKGNAHTTNRIKAIRRKGYDYQVVLKRVNLSEKLAIALERKLILRVGTRYSKAGPLTNWKEEGALIKNKSHHSKACSQAQRKRFENEKEREKISDGFYTWFSFNQDRHEALVEKRNGTLRKGRVRAAISTSLKQAYIDDPSIVKKQRASRLRTWEKNNSRRKISATLGGKRVEVTQNGKTHIFDSQRQVASHLGCWPARINACLHKRSGRFEAGIRLRFVR
jgi:hypothetical protein